MLDLTGGNLVAYLRRIIEDAVNHNPRFKRTLGEVTHQYNNIIQFQDAQVTIKDVTSAGNRLSPDYFLCKTYGRAILAKVHSKEGQFVEWVREIDATRQTPRPGVYYINVDPLPEGAAVADQTNDVYLTMQTYRWVEGKIADAQGSVVYLNQKDTNGNPIDGTKLTAYSPEPGSPPVELVSHVGDGGIPPTGTQVLLFPHFLYLLAPVGPGLELYSGSPPTPLVPLADYWYQQTQQQTVIQSTAGGSEVTHVVSETVPVGSPPVPVGTLISFTLTDQTGYTLRLNKDYFFYAAGSWVRLSDWTPPGQAITAQMVVKVDPSVASGTNPENILQVGVDTGETVSADELFIHTSYGDYTSAVLSEDGTITLPVLLQPGEWCRWEARVDAGQVSFVGKKFRTNELLLPGLRVAIGDNVVVGDQVAIIVSPTNTETYEVYGSKENVTFTIDVRSNDLQTSSEISEMLKQQLLVFRRENMEADGVTIFETSRAYHGLQRDQSGTAPQYTYTVTVSAMCDWKVYVPLVTRMANLEIIENAVVSTGPVLTMQPRARAFGMEGFLESYS